MSTATPSKHDRIERHIQRQRGAGVRSLATSFGFSIGAPAAATTLGATSLGASHPEEPLAKRRKSSEQGALSAPQSSSSSQYGVCKQLPRPAQCDEPQRQLEDIQEHQKELGENTSVTAVKPRGRPRKATTAPAARQDKILETKPAAKKRGRPKKVPGPVPPVEQGLAESGDAALDMAIIAARVAMEHPVARTAAAMASVVKRRGRPKKKTMGEEQDSIPYPMTQETSLQTSRPRRHAATTAMTKVSEGFLEEESDITKKRRDVAAPINSGTTVRASAIEREAVTSNKASVARVAQTVPKGASSRRRAPVGSQATAIGSSASDNVVSAVEHADKVPMDAADGAHMGATEGEPLPRPKRRAAIAANIKVNDGFVEEASDISKKRRDPVINSRAKSVSSAEARPNLPEKPHDTHGAQHTVVVKSKKRDQAQAKVATVARLPLAEAEANTRPASAKNAALDEGKSPPKSPALRSCKASTAGVRSTRPRTSKPTPSGVKKRKAASIFVDCDPISAEAAARSGCNKADTAGESMPIADTSASVPAPRALKSTLGAQALEKAPVSAESRPRKYKSTMQGPKDSETSPREDLKWLCEKPSSRGERPAVKRKPVERKRAIVPDTPDVDVDLDDLLSNIANFVPRTASSGRFGTRRV